MGITPRSGLEGSSARPIRANVPPMGRRAKEPQLTKTNRLPMQRQTLVNRHLERQRMLPRVEHRLRRERLVYSVVPDPARVAERDLPALPVVVLVPEVRDMAGLVRIVRRAWIRHERKRVCVRVRARTPLVRRWVRVRRARRWAKAKLGPKVIVRRDSTEVRDPIAARVPTEVRDRIIEVRDRIIEMVRSKRRSRPRREASFLRPNLRHRSKPSLPSWFRRPNLRRRPSRLRRS